MINMSKKQSTLRGVMLAMLVDVAAGKFEKCANGDHESKKFCKKSVGDDVELE